MRSRLLSVLLVAAVCSVGTVAWAATAGGQDPVPPREAAVVCKTMIAGEVSSVDARVECASRGEVPIAVNEATVQATLVRKVVTLKLDVEAVPLADVGPLIGVAVQTHAEGPSDFTETNVQELEMTEKAGSLSAEVESTADAPPVEEVTVVFHNITWTYEPT